MEHDDPILLLQIRAPDDPMAEHERRCVAARIDGRPHRLRVRNALAEPAAQAWLDGVRAVIIGGSGDFSVHHRDSGPWVTPLRELIEAALERDLPGFGICFGHQLLAHHLGAAIVTDAERMEIGTVELALTEAGRQDPVFGALGDAFRAQTGHSDRVVQAPGSVEVLAAGEKVYPQAFRVRGTRWYSTQFHPDLTGAEARRRYLAYQQAFGRVNPEALARQAECFTLGADDAAVLIGRWVDHLAGGNGGQGGAPTFR